MTQPTEGSSAERRGRNVQANGARRQAGTFESISLQSCDRFNLHGESERALDFNVVVQNLSRACEKQFWERVIALHRTESRFANL